MQRRPAFARLLPLTIRAALMDRRRAGVGWTAAVLLCSIQLASARCSAGQQLQPAQPPDLSTPEAAVRSFWSAINRVDLKSAAICVLGAKPGPDLEALEREMKGDKGRIVASEFHATLRGDRAEVTMRLTVTGAPTGQLPPTKDTAHLRRQNGKWYVVPDDLKTFDPRKEKGATAVLATAMVAPRFLVAARQGSRRAPCQLNLDTLSVCLIDFMSEHGEVLALTGKTFSRDLAPNLKREFKGEESSVFHCPLDPAGGESYSFNSNLENRILEGAAPDVADRIIMVYEGADGKLAFRHDRRAGVITALGNVRFVTPEEAGKLRWDAAGLPIRKEATPEIRAFHKQMLAINRRRDQALEDAGHVWASMLDNKPMMRDKVKAANDLYERVLEQCLKEATDAMAPASSQTAQALRDAMIRYLTLYLRANKDADAKALPLVPARGRVPKKTQERIMQILGQVSDGPAEPARVAEIDALFAFCQEFGLPVAD